MKREVIFTAEAPAPIGPYNQAIKVGDIVYVSGQIALEPATGEFISGGIEAQTKQVMKNLEAILTAANSSFPQVIKCSIFVANMLDFGTVNEIYGGYFDNETAPARETVEVSALPKNALIEISCLAICE